MARPRAIAQDSYWSEQGDLAFGLGGELDPGEPPRSRESKVSVPRARDVALDGGEPVASASLRSW